MILTFNLFSLLVSIIIVDVKISDKDQSMCVDSKQVSLSELSDQRSSI